LKFGGGPADWKRFFCLMGSALALREQSPLVSNTPQTEKELLAELREAALQLRVHQRLQGWTNTLRSLPRTHISDHKWLLLLLDTTQNTIKVTAYRDDAEAFQSVSEIDQGKRTDLDGVLVWVNSVRQLRKAYPNYYADTTAFLEALKYALR